MITVLLSLAALAQPCYDENSHVKTKAHARHVARQTICKVAQPARETVLCLRAEPEIEPVATGPLTKYIVISSLAVGYPAQALPDMASSYSAVWDNPIAYGGYVSYPSHPRTVTIVPKVIAAPEIDPAGLPAELTMLALTLAVIRSLFKQVEECES
jgi:hypothetical protein